MAADPDRPDRMILAVPRIIPVLALLGAAGTLLPLARTVAEGRLAGVGLQVVVGIVGLVLLVFGVDSALVRVELDADGVRVRRWLRTRRLGWPEAKGMSLVSDGGAPRLKIVGRDRVLAVPAWSLRARHADGEVESAAEALPRFGAEHGVRVRVRTLTSAGPRSGPASDGGRPGPGGGDRHEPEAPVPADRPVVDVGDEDD